MTRVLLLTCFTGSALAMPPVPRVVLPEAVVKPPTPGDTEKSDPTALAEQIAKDAKNLGEKLASKDTGPDTLTGQEKLKKDIEKLIDSLENPPPMGGGGGGGGSPPPEGGGSPPPPGGGGGGSGGGGSPPKPMGGGGGGSSGKPSGGRAERKEKRGGQKPEQPGTGQPMPMGKEPMGGQVGGKEPVGGQPGGKGPTGGQPGESKGGNQPGGGGSAKPALPLDEAIARDFWGNLPDLPRQRMMQFFREQYLSRYKDLLPQYYQSLSEKDKKGKK